MSKENGQEPAGGVEAVDRAFRILACFSERQETLSLTALSAQTGFYPSTILRLCESLQRAGFLVRLADKSFALGAETIRLGSLYRRRFHLERHVRPVLSQLVERTGESASYFRREGASRVCLFRVDSPFPIRDHIEEGDVLALDKGAAGHVLTEFADPTADISKLLSALPLFSFGERHAETAAAAVPVFSGQDGLIGALSLSGPLNRFTEDALATMKIALKQAGAALSATLGGHQYRVDDRHD